MLAALGAALGPLAMSAQANGVQGDFNGDGRHDLAIGVPSSSDDAGAVNVIYGAGGGLTAVGDDLWIQSDLTGVSEPGDEFGSGLAVGDFNGDGRDDLAVGVSLEAIGAADEAGAVNVIYGAGGGLEASHNELLTQQGAIESEPQAGDHFSTSLTAGDFDGDEIDDLAVGVPYEDFGAENDAGAVNVIYGSSRGLREGDHELWTQGPGIEGTPEASDFFGRALSAGDFNGDGHDDLAVGAHYEHVPVDGRQVEDAGAVNVIYGGDGGLSTAGDDVFTQDELEGTPESLDRFGNSLATGDFDGDGHDDLAIGVMGEDIGGNAPFDDDGAVNVVRGSGGGLTAIGNTVWSQSGSILGTPEPDDRFGWTLTAADFDGDGRDDLAVGVPGQPQSRDIFFEAVGAVNVIHGAAGGLTANGNEIWAQDSNDGTAIEGLMQSQDHFGAALSAGDFDGNGRADLAVGVPGETVGSGASLVFNMGAVNVIYGATVGGLSGAGNEIWSQDTAGIKGAPANSEFFGGVLPG